jgi:pilus assembly protein CpaE
MKAGVSEYMVAPVDTETLRNAVEEVRTKLATDGKIAKGKIYSFISSKGGLGSTVIAVNSAAALANNKSGSVALCDMSFQSGDSSVLLDMVPATSFADICKNFHRLDVALLRGCMARHRSGLDFLAAPPNPEESEDIRAKHLEKTFDLIKKLYDYTIVDCTSMFIDECTVEAFNASDKVFIVSDMSVPAIRNAARLFQSIKKLGISPQKVEFVVNRYTKGGTLSIEEVEKTLGKRIYWLFPNDFDDIVSSINRGSPLIVYNSQAPFSKNVFDFSKNLLNPQSSQGYRGIRGAFGKAI